MIRGGILGVRCGEILLISSSTLPGLGRVSAKTVNIITNLNAAVSSPSYHTSVLILQDLNILMIGSAITEILTI